ncbi:MAG: hypothetical protein HeimC2_13360 [Candidatus Heimdallarchaeota archaeon LC_2]|nr:MAG: hypothetical protein HeimC2_13360 [Candidatus Heimdallarchaeota archaeon LC_2]
MSIQFLKSSPGREDIGATLILSFAITTRIIQINEDDSLVPFLILSSGIGLLLSFMWTGLTIFIFNTMDRIKNFTNIGGYYYAWTSEHWKTYRIKLVSNSRYFLASLILLIKQKQLITPFIFEWSSLSKFETRIRQILIVFTFVVFLILLWEVNSFKRRLDIVRINGATEDAFELNGLMNQDRWEDVYSRIGKLKHQSHEEFNRLINVRINQICQDGKNITDKSIAETYDFGHFTSAMNKLTGQTQQLNNALSSYRNWSKTGGIQTTNPNVGNGVAQIHKISVLLKNFSQHNLEELFNEGNPTKINIELNAIKQDLKKFEIWASRLYPYGNLSDMIIDYYRSKRG